MAYREVTMVEIKEVLLLWMGGAKKKRIAAQLAIDVKTVRRYIGAAAGAGLVPGSAEITDEQLSTVLHALQPAVERSHGEGWQKCESERAEIERLLEQHVRLSKVRRLLHRRGIVVPYSTLHRFAVAELDFGRGAPTIPVSDGKPGEEIHRVGETAGCSSSWSLLVGDVSRRR
jgi:transposase